MTIPCTQEYVGTSFGGYLRRN